MKDLPPPHDPIEAIGEAYELLLEKTLAEAKQAKEKTGPALHRIIDQVKAKSGDFGKLAGDEKDKIADYLKRDLKDAARYVEETGKSLRDWLGFDEGEMEDKLMDLFSRAADQTTVELHNLKAAAGDLEYYAGELTGPGTLVCVQCGHRMKYTTPGHIVACDKCSGKHFKRDWH